MDIRKAKRQEIADLFGVAGPTVTRWFKSEGCPRNADGSYNLVNVIQWALERERLNAAAPSGTESEESTKWLTKYRKERALKAESERKETEGRLLDADEVKRTAFERGKAVCESILHIPARLSPVLAGEIDPKKVEAILKTELKQALESLSHG